MTKRVLPELIPESLRHACEMVIDNNGVMLADQCQAVCDKTGETLESLMLQLLPLAASYSIANISQFNVGAVVAGAKTNAAGYSNLYLGANFEFDNLALGHSLHAEQAASTNAWFHNDVVKSLAVTAAPCGHCRQFLYEISAGSSMPIYLPKAEQHNSDEKFSTNELNELLPSAFGPFDLGSKETLMANKNSKPELSLVNKNDDELVLLALELASSSYAPYTKNFSGCVVQTNDGSTVGGRYAENAAFNPSLIALIAALSQMRMRPNTFSANDIKRVVMVEQVTQTSQRLASEQLLKAVNPSISFEWHEVTS